jgi:RNA polymerase sigma-70 factor, ECF subfamily
MWESWR